jgi:hypothetical protein
MGGFASATRMGRFPAAMRNDFFQQRRGGAARLFSNGGAATQRWGWVVGRGLWSVVVRRDALPLRERVAMGGEGFDLLLGLGEADAGVLVPVELDGFDLGLRGEGEALDFRGESGGWRLGEFDAVMLQEGIETELDCGQL